MAYVEQNKDCPPVRVEYRYIPRTFKEEQDNPVKIRDLYKTIFSQPTEWVEEVKTQEKYSLRDIDRYITS